MPGLKLPLSWAFAVLVLWQPLVFCISSCSEGKDRDSAGSQHSQPDKIPSEHVSLTHKVFAQLKTAPTAMRGCRLPQNHAGRGGLGKQIQCLLPSVAQLHDECKTCHFSCISTEPKQKNTLSQSLLPAPTGHSHGDLCFALQAY